ncbi:hypothetical protein BDV95DRAFT_607528 [Massariosphaeria phaeospora]|uniref:Uncharacterized protein n=1 Tax=Massariosphaeria phaeospora TaxID=100035 RepID=A0A7C8MK45_9PLEO|nr:hypothetical protein BDV95DRAFT_607528 [Massariosphaeria phaeospora]
MSNAGANGSDSFSDPVTAQQNFAAQYDVETPSESASSYARIMHEHTKKQLSTATSSARRRSLGATGSSNSTATISSTGSSLSPSS